MRTIGIAAICRIMALADGGATLTIARATIALAVVALLTTTAQRLARLGIGRRWIVATTLPLVEGLGVARMLAFRRGTPDEVVMAISAILLAWGLAGWAFLAIRRDPGSPADGTAHRAPYAANDANPAAPSAPAVVRASFGEDRHG